jgi:hypothetical protein
MNLPGERRAGRSSNRQNRRSKKNALRTKNLHHFLPSGVDRTSFNQRLKCAPRDNCCQIQNFDGRCFSESRLAGFRFKNAREKGTGADPVEAAADADSNPLRPQRKKSLRPDIAVKNGPAL